MARYDVNTVINDINGTAQRLVEERYHDLIQTCETEKLRGLIDDGYIDPAKMILTEWKGNLSNLQLLIEHHANPLPLIEHEMHWNKSAPGNAVLMTALETVPKAGYHDADGLLSLALASDNGPALQWLLDNDTGFTGDPMALHPKSKAMPIDAVVHIFAEDKIGVAGEILMHQPDFA